MPKEKENKRRKNRHKRIDPPLTSPPAPEKEAKNKKNPPQKFIVRALQEGQPNMCTGQNGENTKFFIKIIKLYKNSF